MVKWEYCELQWFGDEYPDVDFVRKQGFSDMVISPEGRAEFGIIATPHAVTGLDHHRVENLQQGMTDLGVLGWELVTAIYTGSPSRSITHFYFKRPLS